MMNVEFVPVTEENVEEIQDIMITDEQKKYVAENSDTIELGNSKQTYQGKPVEFVLRAIKYDGEYAGLILLRYNAGPYKCERNFMDEDDYYEPGALINRLMVSSPYQGKGIGSCAIKFAIQESTERGYQKLYLSYVRGPHEPRKFYEKNGFKHTGFSLWGEPEMSIVLPKPKYLYHGSPKLIYDNLTPSPSSMLDYEPVVFATNDIRLACLFIAKAKSSEIDVGYVNGNMYLLELRNDVFKDKLNVEGFIHYVEESLFETDDKLEMRPYEFISRESVPVLKRKYIENVYDALKSYKDITIVTFGELMTFVTDKINDNLQL